MAGGIFSDGISVFIVYVARMRQLLKRLPLTILAILILSAVGCAPIDLDGGFVCDEACLEAGEARKAAAKEARRAECEDTPPIGVFMYNRHSGDYDCVYPDPEPDPAG